MRVSAVSTFHRTPPVDAPGSPDFYNGVVGLRVSLPLGALLTLLEEVESRCGRRRSVHRNAPRTIDLDLLLYGDLELSGPDVRLPHPDLSRAFVALPLLELAPDLALPGGHGSLAQVAAHLKPIGEPLPDFSACLRRSVLR